jgi:hypothetical protein
MPNLPAAHGDKLKALLSNAKLPGTDKPRVEEAFHYYESWRAALLNLEGTFEDKISQAVKLLNDYRLYLDLDVIFDSPNDFLYRQKGQLKLDNTVIEEFLPIVITGILQEDFAALNLEFGPNTCFSSIYFTSSLAAPEPGGGLTIRQKDQDFVISRPVYIQASHTHDFREVITGRTNLAYVAVECKTNLDKTMFQEAAATALDLKTSVPSAKYYVLCEWLDMTPISSSVTAIDEIIILRKAKRLPSSIRGQFNTIHGRRENRSTYEHHLRSNPFGMDTLARFINHVRRLLGETSEDEVLKRGHF